MADVEVDASEATVLSAASPAANPKPWFVYMVKTKSGKLYTGITTDIDRRFSEHQSGKKGAKYFRVDPAQEIVYREQLENRSQASVREAQIKKMRRESKLALILANQKSA